MTQAIQIQPWFIEDLLCAKHVLNALINSISREEKRNIHPEAPSCAWSSMQPALPNASFSLWPPPVLLQCSLFLHLPPALDSLGVIFQSLENCHLLVLTVEFQEEIVGPRFQQRTSGGQTWACRVPATCKLAWGDLGMQWVHLTFCLQPVSLPDSSLAQC